MQAGGRRAEKRRSCVHWLLGMDVLQRRHFGRCDFHHVMALTGTRVHLGSEKGKGWFMWEGGGGNGKKGRKK